MDDQSKALILTAEAKKAQQTISLFLQTEEIVDFCYAYKMRVKPDSKLLEKVERKKSAKKDYCLESITDVIGLRFVTLFRHDLKDVFEQFLKLVCQSQDPKNPLIQQGLEEVIIYSTDPEGDELVPVLQKIYQNILGREFAEQLHVKRSKEGYSSIHLIVRIDKSRKEFDERLTRDIPMEVQIRTVFEDAWGEIDHQYGYVGRTGKDTGKVVKNAESVMEHLKVLKKFVDSCSAYSDLIANDADPSGVGSTPIEKTVPIDQDKEILGQLEGLEVDPDMLEYCYEAKRIKEQGIKENKENIETGLETLLRAAEAFREIPLPEDCKFDRKSEPGQFLLRYYVKMNEGFCLLSTNQPTHVKKAQSIYSRLSKDYGDFPLLYVRLGQALGKLEQYEEAIEAFCKAEVRMQEIWPKNDVWPLELPEKDGKFMRRMIPKLKGYYFWKQSLSAEGKKRAELLKRSYTETESILVENGSPEEMNLNILNNLTYYGVEYLRLNDKFTEAEFAGRLEQEIPFHLSEMQKIGYEDSDMVTLETVAQALHFLKRFDEMMKVCGKVNKLAMDPNYRKFSDAAKLEHAQSVFRLMQNMEAG